MGTVEEFSRIVSTIYSAAMNPRDWVVAMAAISHAADAAVGAIIVADANTRSILSGTVPPEAKESYGAYYRHMDYVLRTVERSPVGLLCSGSELVELKAGSEFDVE
jgi:hypothetical protein